MGRVRIGRRQPVEELRALARDPATTPSVLARLARNDCWDVQVIVAGRPDLPESAAGRLLRSSRWSVRAAVARREHLPPDTARLVNDRAAVQQALAANPNAPAEALARLVSQPDIYVAGVAAANPGVPPNRLAAQAHGMTAPPWVLRNIATNPVCPDELRDEILTWLAIGGAGNGDPHFDPVTCTGDPSDGTVAPFQWYRNRAAGTATPDLSALWRVRALTADFVTPLPFSRIMDLAIDASPAVRLAATRYHYRDALEVLVDDEDEGIARAAAARLEDVPKRRWYQAPANQRAPRPAIVRVAVVLVVLLGIGAVFNSGDDHPTTPDSDAISAAIANLDPTVPSTLPRLNSFIEDFNRNDALADGAVTTPLPDGGTVRTGHPRIAVSPLGGSTLLEIHGGPGPSNLIVDRIDAMVAGGTAITDLDLSPLTIAPNSTRTIEFVGPARPNAFTLRVFTPQGDRVVTAPVPGS